MTKYPHKITASPLDSSGMCNELNKEGKLDASICSSVSVFACLHVGTHALWILNLVEFCVVLFMYVTDVSFSD